MAQVDILMPVRDAAPFLVEAVESLLAQTLSDWRLIAVDDRSRDGSWGMLCNYSKRDERILPLKTEGAGIAKALNTALDHSRAPYLARMDADDLSESRRLEKLLDLLDRDPAASVAGSRVAAFPAKAVTPTMRRYIRWQNSLLSAQEIWMERYVESTMTHASAVFRREALLRADGWRDGLFPEDLDLWLRLHRVGTLFTKHPEVLYLCREHGERETRRSERCSPEAFHRCRVFNLSLELRDVGLSRLAVLGPARARRRWSQSLSSEGFGVTSVDWNPAEPILAGIGKEDFALVIFGVPDVRERARAKLDVLGKEGERWLFAG